MNVRNLTVLTLIIVIISIVMGIQSSNSVSTSRNTNSKDTLVLETSRLKDQSVEDLETLSTPLTDLITETKQESLPEATEIVATGDTIRVNYRGWRASDAFVFDESFLRGDTGFSFTVGTGVIEGWSQGVVGMKVGEIRRLKIPSSLGYGEFGAGEDIPANTDLIFDVELLEIIE